MTTRQGLKRAVRVDRSDADRASADPGPSLPERLYAARERKGVDLYRAERDTKIRARYLGALERGDYKELPGAVYTKGFLRNYALYLGLDPDDVLLQWRKERGDGKEQRAGHRRPEADRGAAQGPDVLAGHRRRGAAHGRRRRLRRVPWHPGAALLEAADDRRQPAGDECHRRRRIRRPGTRSWATRLPGATVSIATPGRDPYQVTATSDGKWSADVDLRRGRNQFDVNALDPDTGKHSDDTIHLFITVPFLVIEAPTLTVDQPAEGASYENGAIPVAGKATNAESVVVSAAWVGSSGPPPAAGQATPAPPPTPASVTVKVADDGSFTTPFELTAGRWTLTVTARSPEGKTASLTRNVTVAYKGVTLVVTVKGGRAWIKVWVDGKIAPGVGAAGQVISNGKSLTFTGRDSIEVRTGLVGRDLVHPERDVARHARQVRACPRRGCSRHPPHPKRRSAASRGGRPAHRRRPRGSARGHVRADRPGQPGRRALLRAGLHIATVESCTGGLVGHLITEIPGSSAYYVGGYVTYSDELKREAVGVPHDVLAAHGAVSAQVAMAMASGGRARTGADLAVAVTGIAGPDGGSPAKPVGLTYVAVADAIGVAVRRHVWTGDRTENKRLSAAAALALLLERIDAPDSEAGPA